jgi:hypothetical protein
MVIRRLVVAAGLSVALCAVAGCSGQGKLNLPLLGASTSAPAAAVTTGATAGATTAANSELVTIAPGTTQQAVQRIEAQILELPGLLHAEYAAPSQQYPGGQFLLVFGTGANLQAARDTVRALLGVASVSEPTAMPS